MKCRTVTLEGMTAIVCSSAFRDDDGRCQFCSKPGTKLCDWIIKKGNGHTPAVTCDKRVCGDHAQEVGPDKDLCPDHQAAYKAWLERKAQRAAA